MDRLIRGVAKFKEEVFPERRQLFESLANSQSPRALFITCADSRIVPDLITQSDPGDLFICRNAGNMVPPYGEVHGGVSATIEYAVSVLEVKHVIICGHSNCGAVGALLHPEKVANLPTVKVWLGYGEVARRVVMDNYGPMDEETTLQALTKENVVAQIDHLRTHPSVATRLARGALAIHGWMYQIPTGELEAYDAQRARFVPISEYNIGSATPPPRLALVG